MKNKIWPDEYQDLAQSEGWDIFPCDGGEDDGKFRIQKIDEMGLLPIFMNTDYDGPEEIFNSDIAAIRFVRKQSNAGKLHAIKALELHNKFVEDFTQKVAK